MTSNTNPSFVVVFEKIVEEAAAVYLRGENISMYGPHICAAVATSALSRKSTPFEVDAAVVAITSRDGCWNWPDEKGNKILAPICKGAVKWILANYGQLLAQETEEDLGIRRIIKLFPDEVWAISHQKFMEAARGRGVGDLEVIYRGATNLEAKEATLELIRGVETGSFYAALLSLTELGQLREEDVYRFLQCIPSFMENIMGLWEEIKESALPAVLRLLKSQDMEGWEALERERFMSACANAFWQERATLLDSQVKVGETWAAGCLLRGVIRHWKEAEEEETVVAFVRDFAANRPKSLIAPFLLNLWGEGSHLERILANWPDTFEVNSADQIVGWLRITDDGKPPSAGYEQRGDEVLSWLANRATLVSAITTSPRPRERSVRVAADPSRSVVLDKGEDGVVLVTSSWEVVKE